MIKAHNFRLWTSFCRTSKFLNLFHTAVMREAAPKIKSRANWKVISFSYITQYSQFILSISFSVFITTENIVFISWKNLFHKVKNSKKHLYLLLQSFPNSLFISSRSVNKPSFSSSLRCSHTVGWESENHTSLPSALTSFNVCFYHARAVLLV